MGYQPLHTFNLPDNLPGTHNDTEVVEDLSDSDDAVVITKQPNGALNQLTR